MIVFEFYYEEVKKGIYRKNYKNDKIKMVLLQY